MTLRLRSQDGMILLPVLVLSVTIAGVAGMAALARHGSISESRIRIEKTRALYLAQGGAAEALACVAGLEDDARPDSTLHRVEYGHGEAYFLIEDTSAKLDVNAAEEEDLYAAFSEGDIDNARELAAAIVASRSDGASLPHWPLRSLDQLLQLPGIAPEEFFGRKGPADILTWKERLRTDDTPAALMDVLTVHNGAATWNDARLNRSNSTFAKSHTYRIIAMGVRGGVSLLLWVTARKEPAHPAGFVVLQRRVL